eukprot:TRINITY_DN101140_c0_g1_i1.p1 TRINITY_DN101140_c0_g1~~TRINITY_DN101140_c0_g1_i1.p1  ORF type:complete len:315 (-),score=83.01 TRINITY_DN101140_c0_g1_i1:66-938(-)
MADKKVIETEPEQKEASSTPAPSGGGYASEKPAEAPKEFVPKRLPKGILPEGIQCPPGTDIMQFIRDLAESGAQFAEQFDRNSENFHGDKNVTPVPVGPKKVPDSMGGGDPNAWRDLPDAPLCVEDDWGPEYHKWMGIHTQLNQCKKAIAVVNKPVEMAMRLRVQYANAEGDDKTAHESRLRGAENDRDGALKAATETILSMDRDVISERTRECVMEVETEGKFEFTDKERYGEYIQCLQRANQAIFMDQRNVLQKIKDCKKAYRDKVAANEASAKKDAPSVEEAAPAGA